MKYTHIEQAVFRERPNRFIAYVEQAGKREICHVKNTGRCRELLVPGAEIYVQRQSNPARKTPLDLIAVRKGDRLINMDSQAPNRVAAEWLKSSGFFGPEAVIKPECRYGNSRFDFYIENGTRKAFMEVKGVTLEENGIVRFPDAPTERGVKHIQELAACTKAGYEAYIFFVIQMKGVRFMEPNDQTHPAFGEALRKAAAEGVIVMARDCIVSPDTLLIDESVEVCLQHGGFEENRCSASQMV